MGLPFRVSLSPCGVEYGIVTRCIGGGQWIAPLFSLVAYRGGKLRHHRVPGQALHRSVARLSQIGCATRHEAYLAIVVFIAPVGVVDQQQVLLNCHVLLRRLHCHRAPHCSTYRDETITTIISWTSDALRPSLQQAPDIPGQSGVYVMALHPVFAASLPTIFWSR